MLTINSNSLDGIITISDKFNTSVAPDVYPTLMRYPVASALLAHETFEFITLVAAFKGDVIDTQFGATAGIASQTALSIYT